MGTKTGKTTKLTEIELRFKRDGEQVRIQGTLKPEGSLNYHIITFPEKSGLMTSRAGIYVRNSTGDKRKKATGKSK